MTIAELGPQELIIIALVVLVLFGGSKIPQLARSLGQAKKEFEEGTKGDTKAADSAADKPSDGSPTS